MERNIRPVLSPHLDVHVDSDTVWLTQQQLAALFGRDVTTIRRHIKNARSEELQGISVSAYFALTATDGKTYQVEHYNLDMILSVGYRVKSKEGVYFRRWANTVLKQHLVQGYTVNQQRLEALNSIVKILQRSPNPEISGTAEIIHDYLPSLSLLNAYDEGNVSEPRGDESIWMITYEEAMAPLASILWPDRAVRTRAQRFIQRHRQRTVPDLRRARTVSFRTGKGSKSVVPSDQRPSVLRRKQTLRCRFIYPFPQQK